MIYIFLFLTEHNPSFTLFLICSYFFTQSELRFSYKECLHKKKSIVFWSLCGKNLKLYEKIFQQRPHSSSQMHKISPYIIASIKTILVTLLLILRTCLSIEINFWKTPLRITFKNLKIFKANICGWVPL